MLRCAVSDVPLPFLRTLRSVHSVWPLALWRNVTIIHAFLLGACAGEAAADAALPWRHRQRGRRLRQRLPLVRGGAGAFSLGFSLVVLAAFVVDFLAFFAPSAGGFDLLFFAMHLNLVSLSIVAPNTLSPFLDL